MDDVINNATPTEVGSQENIQGSQTEGEGKAEEVVELGVESVKEEPKEEPQESDENKGEEGENATHKQSKEDNAFFKHMRIKAEKEAASKFEKQMSDLKGKITKVLPDGYDSVDEFLASIEDESQVEENAQYQKETANPTPPKKAFEIDEKALEELVNKKLEAIPEIKELRQMKEKEKEDKFFVDSFEEVRAKFPDIKKADDVPSEVWDMWDLGKSGRSLLSCLKEHRYDQDIVNASAKPNTKGKAQTNSTAHTNAVNGTGGGNVAIKEDTKIPPETQKMLAQVGVPKDKWASYYQKYHRGQ